MMCLLWEQTEFAEGTVKVRSGAVPRDFVGHLSSGSSMLAFRPGLRGEQWAVTQGKQAGEFSGTMRASWRTRLQAWLGLGETLVYLQKSSAKILRKLILSENVKSFGGGDREAHSDQRFWPGVCSV